MIIDLKATAADERITLPPSITLGQGQRTASIRLPIADDNIPQQPSTYTIRLTIADNSGVAQLNNNQISFTIEDNDLYQISFIPAHITLAEGAMMAVTITTTPTPTQSIDFTLQTSHKDQLLINTPPPSVYQRQHSNHSHSQCER